MNHAGILLAAGASTRMGQPKALLKLPGGATLAEDQANRLRLAGCRDVWMVVGAHAEAILDRQHGIPIAYNPAWASGRWSSVRAGLMAADVAGGYLLLPIDSAGIRPATLRALLDAADTASALALRPVHHGRPGRCLWLSRRLRDRLLATEAAPETRLDEWVAPYQHPVPVEDPAILNNLNTPGDWDRFLREGEGAIEERG